MFLFDEETESADFFSSKNFRYNNSKFNTGFVFLYRISFFIVS